MGYNFSGIRQKGGTHPAVSRRVTSTEPDDIGDWLFPANSIFWELQVEP